MISSPNAGRWVSDVILALGALAALVVVWGYITNAKSNSARAQTARSIRTLAMQTTDHPAGNGKQPYSEEELRQRLTPIQYRVTRQEGTEPAFMNAYWNNHAPGIYVDVVSGEPLFTSLDKFDSGTGWPSFTKPLARESVVEKTDTAHGMERTEVRSTSSDSHLGHVFDDGPANAGGLRYCMNSASLRFVPVDKLKEEGYEKFLPLFEKQK